jgi:hypothetical protein
VSDALVTALVLRDVRDERRIQDARWGEQNHPDGTGEEYADIAASAKRAYEAAAALRRLTWKDILLEEVCEACAEPNEKRLREELVQVAAVAVAWVEAIDRRRTS